MRGKARRSLLHVGGMGMMSPCLPLDQAELGGGYWASKAGPCSPGLAGGVDCRDPCLLESEQSVDTALKAWLVFQGSSSVYLAVIP